jgi:lysozyme
MTPDGLELIKAYEGYRAMPYHDPVGVLTVGYGTTFPLSEDEASWLCESRADAFQAQIKALVTPDLLPQQWDALTSFAYNVGIGAFGRSTLLVKLNAGELDAVPDELRRWVHAGGRVLPGLVRRREAEILLWNSREEESV